MTKKLSIASLSILLLVFAFTANSMADEGEVNTPISAVQAFDAVAKQIDPNTGEQARVALIDVRTTAEYFWVGACGKVDSIVTTSGREYVPHEGKVLLKWGRYLVFKVKTESRRGKRMRRVYLPLRKVEDIITTDISIHVPTHIWDEAGCTKFANPDFAKTINSLSSDYDVIILMCRSGKRSNTRAFDTSLFKTVYEIDQPDGSDGYGGFQGSSYGDMYNGYRGFPGRSTRRTDTKSASWSDAGLPVHIGWTPFAPDVPEEPVEDPTPEVPADDPY